MSTVNELLYMAHRLVDPCGYLPKVQPQHLFTSH